MREAMEPIFYENGVDIALLGWICLISPSNLYNI